MEKKSITLETDKSLVQRSKAGDFQAFDVLTSRYGGRIYNLIRRMLGDPEEAKDVLQETFLNALRNLKNLRNGKNFAPWIFRIATNQSLMKLRQKKGYPVKSLDEPLIDGEEELPRELTDSSLDPAEVFAHRELKTIIDEAINSLPELYRAVLLLKDVEGFTSREVAKMLNLSTAAVKSRLLRGRLAVRRKLAEFFRGDKGLNDASTYFLLFPIILMERPPHSSGVKWNSISLNVPIAG